MRILTSAYACEPGGASEAGYGWNWPTELAALGHRVTVITPERWRPAIEEWLASHEAPGVSFEFVGLQAWPLRLGWGVGSALQYVLWQWRAAGLARRLDTADPFDVVHHVSYGTLLGGSFLWRLGRPFVFGPTGGGQTAGPAFREDFGAAWPEESLRGLVVRHAWRAMWHARRTARAATVLATNRETEALARRLGSADARMMLDVGLPDDYFCEAVPERPASASLELLWVGRIMPRKGLSLTLDAVAVAAKRVPVRLKVVGPAMSARTEADIAGQIERLGLRGCVELTGRVPWDDVRQAYLRADAFILTSLRDSCGVQLLEAMACGLPVITLDHQGAAELVTPEVGRRARVGSRRQAVDDVADAIVELAQAGPQARAQIGRRSLARRASSRGNARLPPSTSSCGRWSTGNALLLRCRRPPTRTSTPATRAPRRTRSRSNATSSSRGTFPPRASMCSTWVRGGGEGAAC